MTNTTDLPKLLTPEEVSEILGISKDTLAQWRHHKRYDLPYLKVGERVRYRPADVRRFIESREQGKGGR